MWCIVNLPNTQNHAVKCDPKSCGQECLEKVCKALGIICEMEYFGLEQWQPTQKDSRTHQWINLRNRLSQDCGSSNGIQLMLALRVKFWVPVHLILQESVRNIFYMQAKTDLLEGRLIPKDWTNSARLSALLCQADGIRFNEACLKAKCPVRMKQEQQQKDKKDKEPTVAVLTFKKRRLSKQKSIESFDLPSNIIASTSTASQHIINNHNQQNNSHNNQRPQLTHQSYSLGSYSSSSSSSNNSTNSAVHAAVIPINSILSSSINCSLNNNSNNNNNNNASSSSTSSTSSSVTQVSLSSQINSDTMDDTSSPLRIYEDYLIRPNEPDSTKTILSQNCRDNDIPEDFLRKIAFEHGKLAKLKMSSKSAKYWLLQEIQELSGYGEEIFSGVTAYESSLRCDIAVGAHGITVATGDETNSIPFSAIAAAKSFRRTFKLEYVNDHNERKDLEIKLPKHCIAAGLYRSITERHAFYVCDKVRGVVTNQFTRDLKGTIASMFKEDTELGKRYVFDIQMTCREVHDQARRTLYERGIEIVSATINNDEMVEKYLPLCKSSSGTLISSSSSLLSSSELTNDKVDQVIKEREDREAAIERCVGTRITEAMTCKICMDRVINSMINPCGHVTACSSCAAKCERCPICRNKITNIVKIFLPTELRGEGDSNSSNSTNNSVIASVNTATTSSKVLAA